MITTSLQEGKNTVNMYKLLKQLEEASVYVGIPESASERKDGEMTNAQILAVNTQGSPLRGLPARPLLEPAMEDPENKEKVNRHLLQAAKQGVQGNSGGFLQELERAGMVAQNLVRAWFVNSKNNWPPLSPVTIEAKGSDRPLIDTGQLRKAITYVVRKK